MNCEKCVSQSKKPAFEAWQKLDKETKEKLPDCLQADIDARIKKIRRQNGYHNSLIVTDGLAKDNMNSF